MKKFLLLMMPAALVLILAAATLPQARHTGAASQLKFVPLIVLAPDDNQTPAPGPVFACVDPDGHPRSTVFHCYTASDIYAAYGVDTRCTRKARLARVKRL